MNWKNEIKKGFGILVLGGIVGYYIGSTMEFFRGLGKDHLYDDEG